LCTAPESRILLERAGINGYFEASRRAGHTCQRFVRCGKSWSDTRSTGAELSMNGRGHLVIDAS
jgi:hypothetical protein